MTAADAPVAAWFVSHRTQELTAIASTATQFGDPSKILLYAGVVATIMWLRERNPERPLIVIAVVVLAVTTNPVFKGWVQRARPATETHLVTANDYAFPSGHATATAAFACVLVALTAGSHPIRRLAVTVAAIVAIGIIALTRMYLGVHWLTDVAAGTLVGCAITSVVIFAARVR